MTSSHGQMVPPPQGPPMKDTRRTSSVVCPTILVFMVLLYWLMPSRSRPAEPGPAAELPAGSLSLTPAPTE
jgi:hypothetical protein